MENRNKQISEEIKNTEIKEILDKQIILEKIRNKNNTNKNIIYISFSIFILLLFAGLIIYSFFKQDFSINSLLTLLLAFFSIGLSVMFYFQSDKNSSSYYMKSYEIMKEVSVALGKIEAGFGEKLTEINTKMSDLKIKLGVENKERDELYSQIVNAEEKNTRIKLTKELKKKESLILELQSKLYEIVKSHEDLIRNLKHPNNIKRLKDFYDNKNLY